MSSKDRTMYDSCTDYVMLRSRISENFIKIMCSAVKTRMKHHFSLLTVILLLTSPIFGSSLVSFPILRVTISQDFQPSAEPPILTLTYYSRTNSTPASLASGSRIAGDHITLNATWSPQDNVNGSQIIVNASAIPNVIKATSETHTVEIDTRALGNNATCSINVTTWLLNGTPVSAIFTNVFLGNFFSPSVRVLAPNGGEIWTNSHNITWIASDRNSDDSLLFEVHLSADDGISYQLLSSDLTTTWLLWDFSTFQNLSSYMVEIRASDGIYEAVDTSDGSFTAGAVNTPSTSTSVTHTTSTTPPAVSEQTQIALFIAAAIIMSAFLSVIVYHQAKRLS